jgi:succinoglycan biosynthesis protein ExoW
MAQIEASPGASSAISLVVPFFQRKRGILTRAVTSALRQECVATPRVIVVDDGSPVDAAEELKDLLEAYPHHLIILRQENQGPGAARNRGILHARQSSEYVAFLDSDDVWAPTHLASAKRALDRGFDFYFCDVNRHDDVAGRDGKGTLFETKAFPTPECRPIDAGRDIFEFTGDLFERILTACPICTPAVVYRLSALPQLFRTDLRTAGEDHFFWLEAASRKVKTAFCTASNVRLGYGVNIYAGTEWGSPEQLWQIFYNHLYIKDAARHLSVEGSYRQAFKARMHRYRHDFINNMISAFLGGRRWQVAPVTVKFLLRDPLTVLWIPPIVIGRLRARLRNGLRGAAPHADS